MTSIDGEATREESADTADPAANCCYPVHVVNDTGCIAPNEGRPLRHDGRILLATPICTDRWVPADREIAANRLRSLRATLTRRSAPPSPAERERGLDRRAARWARTAVEEHASIAAFARASRFSPIPLGPGNLDIPAAPPRSLPDLARDTLRDACVGEALNALLAAERAARASDSDARATWTVLAADEARHAALGWSTLRWLLDIGGAETRAAVVAELAQIERGRVTVHAEGGDLAEAGTAATEVPPAIGRIAVEA